MEPDEEKQMTRKVWIFFREAILWSGTILFPWFLVSLSASNGALGFGLIVVGFIVTIVVVALLFSKEDSRGRIARIAKPVVFLVVMMIFGSLSSNEEAAAMDFARETGRKAGIICKEKGTCPDVLEGFTPGGHVRGGGEANCSTNVNGYDVFYQKREDGTFLITVMTGGYSRFFVSGSPTDPVKDNYFSGS